MCPCKSFCVCTAQPQHTTLHIKQSGMHGLYTLQNHCLQHTMYVCLPTTRSLTCTYVRIHTTPSHIAQASWQQHVIPDLIACIVRCCTAVQHGVSSAAYAPSSAPPQRAVLDALRLAATLLHTHKHQARVQRYCRHGTVGALHFTCCVHHSYIHPSSG